MWGHTDIRPVILLFPWYSNRHFCFVDLCLTEMTELLDGEVDALRSFCTIKIKKMRQQLISKQANGGKSRKLQHGFTAKKMETSDLNCIVPNRLINSIRLKNIRESVKQVLQRRKKFRFCLRFYENRWKKKLWREGQVRQTLLMPRSSLWKRFWLDISIYLRFPSFC